MTSRPRHNGEQGAALLAVLVLTATISALAIGMLEDLRFSIRQTGNLRIREQAVWYALGAEALGAALVRRSVEADPERASRRSLWAQGERRFPINGGLIAGRVEDGGNCFNLNSLVRQTDGNRLLPDERTTTQLTALLAALEIDTVRAAQIAGALSDWLDTDIRVSPRGAEDGAYVDRPLPYRTAGTLLAEPSELRAIHGMDAALYHRIIPFLCAHPTPDPSRLNLNTLEGEQAPLLVMLTNGELRLQAARDVILDRPSGGYASAEDFWAHPAFRDIPITEAMREQVGLMTRFYRVTATIRFRGTALALDSLFRLDRRNALHRIRRSLESAA